jgi:hypothetical protein
MVALNKTYQKPLTPDRSAKDSGYRYYSPELSRWLNRDPLGEMANSPVLGEIPEKVLVRELSALAGLAEPFQLDAEVSPFTVMVNLYSCCRNAPTYYSDLLGLAVVGPPSPCDLYKAKHGTHGSLGFVICHMGTKYGCVWPENWTPKLTDPGLLVCAREHENYHADDPSIPCDKCDILKRIPLADSQQPGESLTDTKYRIECPAYRKAWDCLLAWGETAMVTEDNFKQFNYFKNTVCKPKIAPCTSRDLW